MTQYDAAPVVETFPAYVEARRADIEAALRLVLPQPPACPALMAEAMRYSVEAGRPERRATSAISMIQKCLDFKST